LQNLRKKLVKSGFEIEYSTYIFSFLCLPIFFFRTLPSLLRINKNKVQKTEKEHYVNEKGIVNKVLTKLLSFEIKQINKNIKMQFGCSCLVVAIKK